MRREWWSYYKRPALEMSIVISQNLIFKTKHLVDMFYDCTILGLQITDSETLLQKLLMQKLLSWQHQERLIEN